MKNDSNNNLFYFPGFICDMRYSVELVFSSDNICWNVGANEFKILNKKMGGGECEDKQRQGGNRLVLENKEEVFCQLQGLFKVCPAGGKEQHLAEQALRQ